jgi:DNA invertase Pin-like site-specific DNA recombinase
LSDETSLSAGKTCVLTTTGREETQGSAPCELSSNGLASSEATSGARGRSYVAYYRVSTKQQGQSGLGLEGQQADVLRYLRENPGRLIAEITEIESGKKDDRPKLKEAMRLCRVYDATLVVARLDRLSRSLALISSIMESRLDFVVADFPLANRFTLHILAAVAEYEVWLMAERTRAALAAAKARGVKLGRPRRSDWRAHCKQGNAASTAARLKRARARALDLAPLVCGLRDRGKSVGAIAVELTRL